ncbi:MAG: hypothetical protein R3D85_08095 [Paracoccaceae bacterium]
MPQPLGRLIALHWQGRLALLPGCLLLGLGLRLGLDVLTGLRPPGWPFAATLAVSLLSALVLLWQLVGGARAVARNSHDLIASVAGGAALLATAVLFTVSEIDTWSARALPPRPCRSHAPIGAKAADPSRRCRLHRSAGSTRRWPRKPSP